MYCSNNDVIIDHDGLLVLVRPSFADSFHETRDITNTAIATQWQELFE